MQHRTTFALDEATILRLKILASTWKVSQAEVVRRSVEQAERTLTEAKKEPLEKLENYYFSGGLDEIAGNTYLDEVAENRAEWARPS
jgi:hypothetical protein